MGTICSSADYSKPTGNIKLVYRMATTMEKGGKKEKKNHGMTNCLKKKGLILPGKILPKIQLHVILLP